MEFNAYFIAALVGVLIVEAIDIAGILLNLRALDPKVPAEFADVFDAETYRKAQEYTRARTRLGIVSSVFDLAVLLAFWLAGGFGWLDGVVRSMGIGPIWTGLTFLVILFAAKTVLDIPFGIYATFVLEERFGFNRTTWKTFLLDFLKGAMVSAVIGVPLIIAFLALFQYAGWAAWIYAWVAAVAFSFLMQFLAPRLIMPLFNKFTPLEDGELKEAILAYAEKAHFPVKELFSIDASRRSSKGNAFFTGFGKNKRIALFDTLIKRHTVEELVGVLAHEVGHYKKRHVLIGTVLSAIETGIFLGLFSVFTDQAGLFSAFDVKTPSFYAGVVFVSILLRLMQYVLSVGDAALSRRHERQADRFAAETTGRGDALAAALKRLSKDNLNNLTPHPFYVFLKYSHPPTLQRVRALGD
jgi:STE24 endopeptidase